VFHAVIQCLDVSATRAFLWPVNGRGAIWTRQRILDIECDAHAPDIFQQWMRGYLELGCCQNTECASWYGVACGIYEPIAKRRGEARTAIVA
jgi:hypothetical protein